MLRYKVHLLIVLVSSLVVPSVYASDSDFLNNNNNVVGVEKKVAPDFAFHVREKFGEVLNDKQQRKLSECMTKNYQHDLYAVSLQILDDFKTTGISGKKDFAKHAPSLAEKLIRTYYPMYQDNMAFLSNTAVLNLCGDAHDVLEVLTRFTEKRFNTLQFKRDRTAYRERRAEKPSKKHYKYDQTGISPIAVKWALESGVLRLCQNTRDLQLLLRIIGKDYDFKFLSPPSTIGIHHSSDNMLGWLHYSGALAKCATLQDLESLFNLYSRVQQRVRVDIFMMSERSGVLKKLQSAQDMIRFLTGMCERATIYSGCELHALGHLSGIESLDTPEAAFSVYKKLIDYSPPGNLEGRGHAYPWGYPDRKSYLFSLATQSSAFAVCTTVEQLERLLTAIEQGDTVKILSNKDQAQEFRSFDQLIKALAFFQHHQMQAKAINTYFHAFPSVPHDEKDTKTIHEFRQLLNGLRGIDRQLAQDIYFMSSLMLSEIPSACVHREKTHESYCLEQECQMRKLVDAFLFASHGTFDNGFVVSQGNEVLNCILDWTPQGDGGHFDLQAYIDNEHKLVYNLPKPYKAFITHGRLLQRLSDEERAFFFALPFKTFEYETEHLWNGFRYTSKSYWSPVRGYTLERMIDFAARMPADVRARILAQIQETGLAKIKSRNYYGLTTEEVKKLGTIRTLFEYNTYESSNHSWEAVEQQAMSIIRSANEQSKGKEEVDRQ